MRERDYGGDPGGSNPAAGQKADFAAPSRFCDRNISANVLQEHVDRGTDLSAVFPGTIDVLLRAQHLLDKAGIGVSLACAVHCVLAAGLALVPALAAGGAAMELVEGPLLWGALALGTLSLAPSYRHHRNVAPISWFVAGVATIALSHTAEGLVETLGTVCGVALVSTGHVMNMRLAKRATPSAEGGHDHAHGTLAASSARARSR